MAIKQIFCLCVLLALVQLSLCVPKRERRQLPCNHPLKLVVPELFEHCSACTYTSWSFWYVLHSEVVVATSVCSNGKAFIEERNRTSDGIGCIEPLKETRTICEFKWVYIAIAV